jgi:prophage tail gpP-like protein
MSRMRRQRGGRSLREYLRHEWGYDQSSAPEVSPTMTWAPVSVETKQVVAQLQGSAEVAGEAKIVVEAGSSLLDVVRQAQEAIRLSGKLNVNGPGSPGLSAPDTAARRHSPAWAHNPTKRSIERWRASSTSTSTAYTGFEEVTVRAAFNEAARAFSVTLAAELGASATNRIFDTDTEVTITTTGELLLTGYIDSKNPHVDANDAWIEITGRSRSADLIDSSAMHDTGYFENQDPLQIGQAISQGIGAQFTTDQQLDKLDQYKIQQGETCFRCIEKMVRDQGMTITGTKDGNALITKAGTKRQSGSLIEGVNIMVGDAHHNTANRHSKIIVRGQRPFGHGDENLSIEATETDSAVKRHRTHLIVQDNDTTQKRAKARKQRTAGNALKATIRVQGFHDGTGQLWEPGHLVWTESPFLDLAQDMLIESVEYKQTNKGSTATIALVDPRAYGGAGSVGSGNQSGDDWEFGDDVGNGSSQFA